MEEDNIKSIASPKRILAILYLLGISTMLPWNFFITADSFWQYKLRNTSLEEEWNSADAPLTHLQVAFMPTIVIVSNVFCFSFGFVNTALVNRIREEVRILSSLLTSLASMGIITLFSILNTDEWQSIFFAITITMVALLNIGIAVEQASLYGMVGSFPSNCINALVGGQALAGIISSLSQIFSLAAGSASPAVSGIIYFALADMFLILSTFSYFRLTKTVFYKVAKSSSRDESKLSSVKITWKNFTTVFSKIKWMSFSMGFTLLVTLCIYPAVQVYVTSTSINETWASVYFQPVITFLVFNCFDLSGRELTRFIKWPGHKGCLLHVLATLRLGFIPLIMLCHGTNKSFTTVFYSDAIYIILNAMFAFTNGYIGSLALIYYPRVVEENEMEFAGSLMAAFMGVGMVSGSLLSPAFVAWWGPLS